MTSVTRARTSVFARPWLLAVVCLGAVAFALRLAAAADAFEALALIKPTRVRVAEEFAVPTPNGQSIRLADYRGRVVLLNFWATWCPPCQAEMPAMERLYQGFKDRGFVLLAISVDADGGSVVKPFLQERKFTYPIGLDPKMALAGRYGVRALPSSFLVDKRGTLVALAMGPREWDSPDAHAAIESLLTRP